MKIRSLSLALDVKQIFLLLFVGLNSFAQVEFEHQYLVNDQLPEQRWGFGTPVLADFDNDDDLDYAFCMREDSIYWFENTENRNWVKHTVGAISNVQLGAASHDVDKDGFVDLIIGGNWYKNNGKNLWLRSNYDSSITDEVHDVIICDVNADKIEDVVILGDKIGLYWYDISKSWSKHLIDSSFLNKKPRTHGGISPKGFGDLDGDGDIDLVLPTRWLENRNNGQEWKTHELPFGKAGKYGLSIRSWVVDLDKDGDQDIVVSDSDQKGSQIAWLENIAGRFDIHFLKDEEAGTRGSFHSLAVADFDNDGDLDIVTAEQEAPDIFPENNTPKWFLWNNDGFQKFTQSIIFDAKLGGHDIFIGDLDNDGDIDIASKVWSVWSENANGGKFHADVFYNNLINFSTPKE